MEPYSRRALRLFFAATLISVFGSGLNYTAVLWALIEQTGSTRATGLLLFFVMLPALLVPAFTGVVIDRTDRRYVLIAIDVIRALAVLAIPLLIWSGRFELWNLYAVEFVLGAGFAVYWPAAQALAQEIAPGKELIRANSVLLVGVQSGMMLAGACMGFLYERIGLAGVLMFDVATYGLSILCFYLMRSGKRLPQDPTQKDAAAGGSLGAFFEELREGWEFLRSRPTVLSMGLTYAFLMAGVMSGNVVLVALVKDIFDGTAESFGLMEAGWGLGALVGGVMTGWIARRSEGNAAGLWALGVLAVGHVVLPHLGYLMLAVAAHVVFGFCRALVAILAQSGIMAYVPQKLMGRTNSTFSLFSTAMQMVLALMIGELGARYSLAWTFVILGIMYTVAWGSLRRVRVPMAKGPIPSRIEPPSTE